MTAAPCQPCSTFATRSGGSRIRSTRSTSAKKPLARSDPTTGGERPRARSRERLGRGGKAQVADDHAAARGQHDVHFQANRARRRGLEEERQCERARLRRAGQQRLRPARFERAREVAAAVGELAPHLEVGVAQDSVAGDAARNGVAVAADFGPLEDGDALRRRTAHLDALCRGLERSEQNGDPEESIHGVPPEPASAFPGQKLRAV